jgi:hypothetical protein
VIQDGGEKEINMKQVACGPCEQVTRYRLYHCTFQDMQFYMYPQRMYLTLPQLSDLSFFQQELALRNCRIKALLKARRNLIPADLQVH